MVHPSKNSLKLMLEILCFLKIEEIVFNRWCVISLNYRKSRVTMPMRVIQFDKLS